MSGFVSSVSRNRWLLFSLLIVFGIGILAYMGYLPMITGAIISVSKDVNFDNGKVYTIVELTIDKQQIVSYVLSSSDYTLNTGETLGSGTAGDIVRPTTSHSLRFTPATPKCEYRLVAHGEPVIAGVPLNLYYYYTLHNVELSAPIKIWDSKTNTEKMIDGTNIGETTSFGSLNVQTQGVLIGKTFCPDGAGVYVLDAYGTPKVVDSAQWVSLRDRMQEDALLVCALSCTPPISLIANCNNCLQDKIENVITGRTLTSAYGTTFSEMEFDDSLIKTELTAYARPDKIANPVLIITADQTYFDSIIYSPPKTYRPEILTTNVGKFNENQQSTFAIRVKNTGNAPDTFRYTISTNKGTIRPTSEGITIGAGSEALLNFQYSPPTVSARDSYRFDFRICSHNQIESECDSQIYTGYIEDVGVIPPPNPCGNGICEPLLGETYITCSTDCIQEPPPADCSAIPNSYYINGICECNSGFVKRYDAVTGEQICEKPSEDWLTYAIYGTIGLVLLGGGYMVYKSEFKRKRR